MELRTLAHTTLSQITATFNKAFEGYFIPLQFTEEGMAAKIRGEGIVKAYSVGAFEGEQLVGFMLHGYEKRNGLKWVYNGGTGVIPQFRGKGITKSMYRYAIPLLEKEGIRHHLLEVIHENHAAKKVYDAVGFQTIRSFAVFKTEKSVSGGADITITNLAALPSDPAFLSMPPSWQNSFASINRDRERHHLLGVYLDGELVGYAAYIAATGRVRQCAVLPAFRRKKIGTALFQYMWQNSATGTLLLTNIDEAYAPGIAFMKALGFDKILGLYEMTMEVK